MVSSVGSSLARMLAEISGYPVGDHDYLAYFENEHGEQLMFVRAPGASYGVLLHSDLGWEPKPVAAPPKPGRATNELPPKVRLFLGDVPVVGEVILNSSEAIWLKACLAASTWYGESPGGE
ncbi:MAG TPA: hypothetical protein VL551_24025 [Actinospica sp.]|nr:hypothetical protein [Actinospica sp.]